MSKKWYILREDFNANVFVMNARPFDSETKAKEVLADFLAKQLKPHHQDYQVTSEVPKSAKWDLATL